MNSNTSLDSFKKTVQKLMYQGNYSEIYQKIDLFVKNVDLKPENLLDVQILHAMVLSQSGEYEKSLNCVEEIILRSSKDNNPKQYLDSNIIKIGIYALTGKGEEALKMISDMESYLEEKKELIPDDRLRLLADLKYNKGSIYWASGKTDLSLNILYECLRIRKEIDDKEHIGYTLNRIGTNYYFKGEMEKALSYYKQNLDIQTNLENISAIGTCHNNIADIYYVRGEYGLALESYENAFVFQTKAGNDYLTSIISSNMGYIYTLQGEYERALPLIKRAVDYYLSSKNLYIGSFSLFYMISLLLEYTDTDEDIDYYIKLFGDLNKESDSEYVKAYYQLSKALIFKSKGTMRDRIKSQALLEHFTEREIVVYDITFLALLNLAELLLIELKESSDDKILDKLENLTIKMLNLADRHNSAPYRIKTYILQSKLALMKLNVDKANQLLDNAGEIAENNLLKNLSIKILEEKQRTLTDRESWEQLTDMGAPVSERVKLSQVEDTVSQMVGHRVEIFQELDNLVKKFKLEDLSFVVCKFDQFGGKVVTYINPPDEKAFQRYSQYMAVSFMTTLGQGDQYHEGLYGPLPVPFSGYSSMVYSKIILDSSQTDPRLKGKTFSVFCMLYPQQYSILFYDRKTITETFEKRIKQLNSLTELSEGFLAEIRKEIFNKITGS